PQHGVLELSPDGLFSYTPAADYNGPDSFTYRGSDGPATSNVATVALTMTPVNEDRKSVVEAKQTAEDTRRTIGAPGGAHANEPHAGGETSTARLAAGSQHGVLALSSDGLFSYTPAANYNGADSFTYRASDGPATSNVATVALTITPVN